jgi:hypothetical protein
MATRRKPRGYRDGGRVLADVPIAGDEPGGFPAGILGDQTKGTHGLIAEPPPADDNPLMHALAAQTRAEQLQHEAAQRPPPSPIEHRIEKFPGLSEHKRAFLRQFPVLIEDPAVMQVFNRHYAEALQSGFADDTAELDNHLITATVREIELRRQLALAQEPVEAHVQRLEDEAAAIDRSEQPPAPVAPPPMPPRKKSIPMSAPVSRDSPMMSGDRRPENTLSADERMIARVSFKHLPPAQAEYEYLLNKRKMMEMKRDGRIQGDG